MCTTVVEVVEIIPFILVISLPVHITASYQRAELGFETDSYRQTAVGAAQDPLDASCWCADP